MLGERFAGELGEGLVDLLKKSGLVAVREEYLSALEAVREKHEVAFAALDALTRSPIDDVRRFAEISIERTKSPDGATPFADLRLRVEKAENYVVELRGVLRRVVEIVDQERFIKAVSLMEADDVFSLGERTMLLLALREANRCLDKER